MNQEKTKTPPGRTGGAEDHKREYTHANSSTPSNCDIQDIIEGDKEYTKRVFLWIDQVAADSSLPLGSARLAVILLRYFNRDRGYAWPSVARLADDLSTAENTIRAALKALKDHGHLSIETGGGRAATNRYSMVMKSKDGGEKPCKILKGNDKKPSEELQGIENKHLENLEGLGDEALQNCDENPSTFEDKPFRKLKGNHYKNQDKNNLILPVPSDGVRKGTQLAMIETGRPARTRSRIPNDREKHFGEFWAVYPSQANEHGSRGEYFRQLDKGEDPARILAGAIDYAKYIRDENKSQYVLEGINWLRHKRWNDDWRGKITNKHGNHIEGGGTHLETMFHHIYGGVSQ